jgi:uncharacterized ParB-like nuclease family protein
MQKMMLLPISKIRTDGDTQPRTQLRTDVVTDYAEDISNGQSLPPIVVYHDGLHYWIADGYHRLEAHRVLNRKSIEAVVHKGGVVDARLYAASSNANHGIRRTPEDKRRAVHMVIADPTTSSWTTERIAEHCHVSVGLVRAIRISSRWKPAAGLFPGTTQTPPPKPDYAKATAATKAEKNKIIRTKLTNEERQGIEERVKRLVRKLSRFAHAMGTTPETLLLRHLV